MTSLTIAENGQLTLGQEELHHLGLQPGDTLELDRLPGGELRLKPVAAQKTIKDFIGRHAGKVKTPLTIEEMNETIAAGWAGELELE